MRIQIEQEMLAEEERKRILLERKMRGEEVEEEVEKVGNNSVVKEEEDEEKKKEDEEEKKEGEAVEAQVEEEEAKDEAKLQELESASEDEYVEITIKSKMREFLIQNPGVTRYPATLMNEAVRWRLNQNDCQNRGYVLDGYPKDFDTSEGVFVIKPVMPERKMIMNEDGEMVNDPNEEIDEEELKALMKPKFQKNIYPDSVILIRASSQSVISQSLYARLTSVQMQESHWMPDVLDRRYTLYTQNNDIQNFQARNKGDLSVPYPLIKFFQENQTEIYEVDFDGNELEMFEGMRIYIERNGRPYNYLSSVQDMNAKREEQLTQEEADKNAKLQQEQNLQLEQERKMIERLENLAELRMKEIGCHMHELEFCDKLNMR